MGREAVDRHTGRDHEPQLARRLGGIGHDRRRRAGCRDRGSSRLPPHDLQRARRVAGVGDRPPRRAVLGSPRHVRLPRGTHPADPVRDLRARARVPPPPRARQALRHARRRQRWPRDPGGRRRHAEGGVRPHRRPLRRARPALRRRAAARCGRRSGCPSLHTTATTTTSRAWSSIPCAVQERMPIWVGGRTLRSVRRAATLADGWCPFAVTPAQAQEWLGQVELPPASTSRSLPPRASTRSTNPRRPKT